MRLAPAPAEGHVISAVPLESSLLKDFNALLQPSAAEIKAMLQSILERKKWSQETAAAVLNIPIRTIACILGGQPYPGTGSVNRLIWLMHELDNNPGMLDNPLYFTTWGKSRGIQKREQKKTDPAILATIRDRIAELKSANKRLTIRQIVNLVPGSEYDTVFHLCRTLDYKPRKAARRRWPRELKTNSPWVYVDWSMPNEDIAAAVGVCAKTVELKRRKMRKYPLEWLRDAFAAVGREGQAAKLIRGYARGLRVEA